MSVLLSVAILAAAFLALGFFGQRAVMFPAPRRLGLVNQAGIERVRLELPFGVVESPLLPGEGAGARPLILFTHGNGELASDWVGEFDQVRRRGWSVLLLEYPGYGGAAGSPSEATVLATAEAAFRWAGQEPRIDGSRIVAWGRSLGGGAAARLAADHQLPGLILESAFTSVRPLAARFLLPGFLVRDPFDNLAALTRFRGRLLVIHGARDEVIPVSHGRALAAMVPGAVYRELDCGHNDCPRPWDEVARLLEGVGPDRGR